MVTHSPRKCPECGSVNTMVYDSRSKDEFIVRKRTCSDCDTRFQSYEILADDYFKMKAIIAAHSEYVNKVSDTMKESLEEADKV